MKSPTVEKVERIEQAVTAAARVRVWDAPTRLFHWTAVSLVAFSWFTADNGLIKLHLWSGSALLALLIFRVLWGFAGSTTARFAHFVKGPQAVIGYIFPKTKEPKALYAGHNPAGGWMVIVLIAMLCAQAVIGLFANDDVRFNGPLSMLVGKDVSDRLTELHGVIFNCLLALIWAHVVAVLFYLFVKGENLIGPMCHGSKDCIHVPPGDLKFARSALALGLLLLSAGAVWWIVAR